MSSKHLNFTKRSLLILPLPLKGKRDYYRDTIVKGLILDVRSSGSKSFYLYKFINGKPERIFLGVFPDFSVENARDAATTHKSDIAKGKNPQEEKRKIRDETTFEELFNEYMERYSKLHKKSWQYDEREVKKFLSHWFKRKLSDIKKLEIQLLLEKIYKENGLYQSNRILERIRAIYNKAIEWGWDGINPAIGIKKYKEKSRDRFIQPAEMPCLIKSLNEEHNEVAKDYFWFLLLTGVRRTNTLTMRWEQVNWERQEWRIPDTKNGEPIVVPLLERAMEILHARRRKSNGEWVFPNEIDSSKHLINFKRSWKRTLQKATIYYWLNEQRYSALIDETSIVENSYEGVNLLFKNILSLAKKEKLELPVGLMDIRIHDVRRTFGSYQAITGASLQIIGQSLGHKSPQATQIYARLNLDPVRTSVEKAINAMFINAA